MDRDTVLDLLAIIAAGDHRTIGEPDIVLWQRAIGHLDANDCVEAIEAFRRDRPGVWLEPGHVVQWVRGKVRDRLDRADPEERASMLTTAAGVKRDSFGAIDKAAVNLDGDDDFPHEWTSEQRLAAYWGRVRDGRERREYEMGMSGSPKLLKNRPAGSDVRSQVMAEFADKRFGVDGESSAQVDPLAVACPFCKVKVRSACTVAGQEEQLRSVPAHPSRLELAARKAGYSDEVVEEIVSSAQRRQAQMVQAVWAERDKAPVFVGGGREGDA